MSDFGELLKSLRQGANLTQKQLSDRIFVSETMVSYYEHSRRPPSADVLMQIAEVFHVSVDYLLGREKKEQTLNLRGLSDKDMEFLQSVILFLQEKNDEQGRERDKEQNRKKKEEHDREKNEEQDREMKEEQDREKDEEQYPKKNDEPDKDTTAIF